MFKTKIQFHTHLSSWICAGHFQGLMLEMTVEAISNSYCPYYLQWMAFPFSIHQEQCVRNTTALPQFKTWETCHPSPGEGKGQVRYLTGTVTQRWTDRLHPTSWAFSHLLNNYTNISVWEKICNVICSKISDSNHLSWCCIGSGWIYFKITVMHSICQMKNMMLKNVIWSSFLYFKGNLPSNELNTTIRISSTTDCRWKVLWHKVCKE